MDAKKNTIAFPDPIMPSRCLRHSIKRYQKAKFDWCHWCILMHDWKPELLVFSIGVLEPPMCVFFRPNWIWNSDAKWHWHCFLHEHCKLEFLHKVMGGPKDGCERNGTPNTCYALRHASEPVLTDYASAMIPLPSSATWRQSYLCSWWSDICI